MTETDEPAAPDITVGMFPGPRRLRPLSRVLRHVPQPLAESILAAVALGDGFVRFGRFRGASRWAAAQGATGWARRRMALAVLANHGRFVAAEAMLGVARLDDLSRDVDVVGAEHLRARHGALLVGFHLGPPRTWLTLRALGYPVRFAGRLTYAARDPAWTQALASGAVVRLPEGEPGERARALYGIRRLLRNGGLVYVTADGPFGREAFQVQLPGGPLAVRTGWLALRRHAGVPTLPVFVHREGRRRVIVVHPALPEADADAARDAEVCREVLTPLVREYVARYPTQCRYLALPRWRSTSVRSGEG